MGGNRTWADGRHFARISAGRNEVILHETPLTAQTTNGREFNHEHAHVGEAVRPVSEEIMLEPSQHLESFK